MAPLTPIRSTDRPGRDRQPVPLRTLMRRPARVGLGVLAVLMATVIALNVVVAAFLMANWSRAGRVLVALEDTNIAMLDQETGLRVFLITR